MIDEQYVLFAVCWYLIVKFVGLFLYNIIDRKKNLKAVKSEEKDGGKQGSFLAELKALLL